MAVDTSAKVTSVAVVDENGILAEFNSDTKLTHSQALMPMIEAMLSCSKLSLEDIDGFACAVGPGSFTGLRIGIGAIKGLAYGKNKPCVGISTLDGLTYNLKGFDGIVCAAMDARCNQVYTSISESSKDGLTALHDDCAISIDELADLLKSYKKNIFFVGDGANLCYNRLKQKLDNIILSSELVKYQRASSIGFLALEKLKNGQAVTASKLMPVYLRLPQAQRELLKKREDEKN
ncbi:MAG: tRNA (adenosine(37)-N6)-threonylcarbamoyltransferase complex dimerization subunit type 1 TsaB [Oscillospiraceae bacterium]